MLSACHDRMGRQCATLRRLRNVRANVVQGESVPLASNDVEALVDQYERHIEREETELLPMAARLLSADDLDRVGRAMRERRRISDHTRGI